MTKKNKINWTKNILLWIFFACPFLISFQLKAQLPTEKKVTTKIFGNIKDATESTIGIKFYRDIISRDEEVFDIPLYGKNQFTASFQLNASTSAFLIYNGEEIPLYLDPGDELYINSTQDDFGKNITFAGEGAGKSRYLKNVNKVFPEIQGDYIFYEIVDRKPLDFKRYMDRLHQKMWQFYKSLPDAHKVGFSPDFESFIKADIDYWYAYNLLRYRVENPLSNGIYEPIELPVEYYSFLNAISISNDQALTNRNYLFFIDQYISFRNHLYDSESETVFLQPSLVVTVPSMLIFAEPNSPPILEEVKQGTALKYLGEKTKYKSPIMIKDKQVEDVWYQVKNTKGEKGWIHGAGVEREFQENKNIAKQFVFGPDSRYRNVYKMFTSKTLFYILANNLYWSGNNEDDQLLEKKLNDFIELNPYESFDSILLYAIWDQKEIPPATEKYLKIVQNIDITRDEIPTQNSIISESTIATNTESINANTAKGSSSQTTLPVTSEPVFSPLEAFVIIDPRPTKRSRLSCSFSGKIESPTGAKPKLMLYADPITMEEIHYEMEVSNDGFFELALQLSEPTIGVFFYGKYVVDVYIEPGDLMQVLFSGINFNETIQFAGTGSAHNNYLRMFKKKFAKANKDAQKKAEKSAPDDYEELLNKIKTEKSIFLNSSKYRTAFSEKFKTFAQAEIDFWFGYLMLNYPWEYGFANNMNGPVQMPIEYYNFLDQLPVSAENVLPNLYYTYYLDQFISYQKDHPQNANLSKSELIDKYLVGEPAAYFKAKELAIACKRGKAREVGGEIKTFIEKNSYEMYNDVLRLVYNEAKGLQVGGDAPSFALTDLAGNEIALSDLKGKVVYLDFWATWCSPCLHQMKNSKTWKSKFSEKDVVFLYISLDKNKAAWERFLKNNDIQGLHLFASGGDVYKSQIAKLYKVKKLPAYFLIDKDGKIAFKPERGKNISRIEDKIQMLIQSR